MNSNWWKKSVVYQIYPRSFKDSNNDGIGDIKGIISKIPYLHKLGIDVIWLSPVYRSPMKDNGYDISDYKNIDPLFGSLEDIEELIRAGKKHNIRLVMDLVINHTSDQHPWFLESKKSKDNPYRDYYIWREKPSDLRSVFGGSSWTYDKDTNQYYFHHFAKEQPDLNWENPKVRDEMISMINWWLEKGVGGFRLDVIDLIGKEVDKKILGNGPNLHPFLKVINNKSFGKYDVMTVGETWGANPEQAELYSDPDREELSMIFQFEHMTIDWGSLGKWNPGKLNLVQLKKILSKWQTDLKKGWNSLFWNNHDLPRIVSRWGNDKDYRVESAKMLAITLHMMKGTPYIYQGEEIGMTNVKYDSINDYNDVEIHGFYKDLVLEGIMTEEAYMNGVYKMGRDNARTPMQWDNSINAGFTKGNPWLKVNTNYIHINVQKCLLDENSIFYTYQKLISLRKNPLFSDTIIYGEYEVIMLEHPSIFAYKRFDDTNELIILSNFSSLTQSIDELTLGYDVIINNYQDVIPGKLLPYQSIVFFKRK